MIGGAGLLNSNAVNTSEKVKKTGLLNSKSDLKSDLKSDSKANRSEKTFANELDSKSARGATPSSQRNDNSIVTAGSSVKDTSPREESVQEPKPSKKNFQPKEKINNAPMVHFLNQMQSEFGVSAEEVLEAFSNLSLEELASSPENTAEYVIASLDLEPEEASEALGLYNEMLAASMGAGGATVLAKKNGADVNIKVMDSTEERIKKLQGSLDNMSDKFFNTGKFSQNNNVAQTTNGSVLSVQSQPEIAQPTETVDSMRLKQSSEVMPPGMMPSARPQERLPTELQRLAEDQSLAQMQSPTQPLTQSLTQDQSLAQIQSPTQSLTRPPTQQEMPMAPPMPTPDAVESVVPNNNSELVNETLNANDLQKINNNSAGLGAQSDSMPDDKDDSMNSESHLADVGHAKKIEHSSSKDTFILNGPKPTGADMQSNIKEIISQAQFLASKGGGEMKISLNPEGMGELKLRVKSIAGQINVEMITSSSESKKLLERGLNELKDNFSAHKLNLDSIKIESGKEISHHMDQQQRDFDRGHQERFLGDFRERNNNFKREMFEFGAPSVPTSQTRDQAANVVYGSAARKNRYTNSGSSGRLDLVA